jgi:hypothetical protein
MGVVARREITQPKRSILDEGHTAEPGKAHAEYDLPARLSAVPTITPTNTARIAISG